MTVVVKIGGSILGEGVDPSMVQDVKNLYLRREVVLVHGGGDIVTETAEKLGKPQQFIESPDGIRSRYTDRETAEIYTMVMTGKIGNQIVAALQSQGMDAVGLSGLDAGLIRAERKRKLLVREPDGRKRAVEGGFTGKIGSTSSGLILLLLESGYLPVISPVALGQEFEFLNVDGDRAAAYVAGGLKAEKVVFLTDVPGVLQDGNLIESMNLEEAKAMLPKIGPGMEKKVMAAIEALEMGVVEGIIASGLRGNPLKMAMNHQGCTVIRRG